MNMSRVVYAIRQKGTNCYLPAARIGHTYDEPVSICHATPRLFDTKRAALAALTAWAKGHAVRRGNGSNIVDYTPVPHRDKKSFYVVALRISVVPPKKQPFCM